MCILIVIICHGFYAVTGATMVVLGLPISTVFQVNTNQSTVKHWMTVDQKVQVAELQHDNLPVLCIAKVRKWVRK